jgi:hypothetical protein
MIYQHEQDERPASERKLRGSDTSRPVTLMPKPAWKNLSIRFYTYLKNRDLNATLAIRNGWYPSQNAGDKQPRIVIPATSRDDRAYWQARAMNSGAEKRYQSPYTPREDAIVIVYPAKEGKKQVIAVEGPMDALAAAGEGWIGVSFMGNQPAREALDHFAERFEGSKILVLPDRDDEASGLALAASIAGYRIPATCILLQDAKDLAEMTRRERGELFQVYA